MVVSFAFCQRQCRALSEPLAQSVELQSDSVFVAHESAPNTTWFSDNPAHAFLVDCHVAGTAVFAKHFVARATKFALVRILLFLTPPALNARAVSTPHQPIVPNCVHCFANPFLFDKEK
jgi:hypothetical protein